jgi:hypothetical protein
MRTLYCRSAAADPIAAALSDAAWTVRRAPFPAATLSTAAAQAAAARTVASAQRALGGLDVVVLAPRLASRRTTAGRLPTRAAWHSGLSGPLRAAWLLGRAAALALSEQGRGSLIVVIEAAAAEDAMAAVAGEALRALVDGLRKAVPVTVDVVAVEHAGGRGDAARAAAAVRHAVEQSARRGARRAPG